MNDISVELQSPMSYSSSVIIAALILLVVASAILYIVWKKVQFKPKDEAPETNESSSTASVQRLPSPIIKARYVSMLDELIFKIDADEISNKLAYSKITQIIRAFSAEMCGIDLSNMTLHDIEQMNLPWFSTLIAECYEPIFSSSENVHGAREIASKTRELIASW